MDYNDMNSHDIYHFGVKGMKWGVRRYQNEDGSLTEKGIKRYATKGYAQDAYNSNKTKLGKAYDLYTGSHKHQADFKYNDSSKKANLARAKKYLKDKEKSKNTPIKEKAKNAAKDQLKQAGAKSIEKHKKIKKAVDDHGAAGAGAVLVKSTVRLQGQTLIKGVAAGVINSTANSYITSSSGSYAKKVGVDFARKAAIGGLAVSSLVDHFGYLTTVGSVANAYGERQRRRRRDNG